MKTAIVILVTLILAFILFMVKNKKTGTSYLMTTEELYQLEDSLGLGFDGVPTNEDDPGAAER